MDPGSMGTYYVIKMSSQITVGKDMDFLRTEVGITGFPFGET